MQPLTSRQDRPGFPAHAFRQTRCWTTVLLSSLLMVQSAQAWQDESAAGSAAGEKKAEPSQVAKPEQTKGENTAARPQANEIHEIRGARASSFQNVTPGQTKLAQAKQSLGDPIDQQQNGAETTLTYKVGPFPKVEIIVRDELVSSVVIHLQSATKPEEIETELGLNNFAAAPIYNERGEFLGQAYPERGVLFSFVPGSKDPKVGQVVLEPITAEPFLLRAQHDGGHQYQKNLADINHALQLEPHNAKSHWLKAEILAATGSYTAALKAVEEAVRLSPKEGRYRLTRAAVLAELGDHGRATAETQAVLADKETPLEVLARAHCQLGDLMAAASPRQYKEAMSHHLAAVKLATPLGTDVRADVRRRAKRVLIDAYLAVANDIAGGHWQNKQQTVPKWLKSADELAAGMIKYDAGDQALRLHVFRQSLAAYAGMSGAAVGATVADDTLEEGQRLIDGAEDPLYKGQLQWQLVEALFDAAQIEQARGAKAQALKYANHAVSFLASATGQRESTPQSDYLIGRVYFFVGATYAVDRSDHKEAVRWYERALPHVSRPLPPSEAADLGRHGERLVSMGVSYWQTGVRNEGIELTRKGLEMMKEASQSGLLDPKAMAVPYGNLAAMYREDGKLDEAKELAASAAKLETAGSPTKKR